MIWLNDSSHATGGSRMSRPHAILSPIVVLLAAAALTGCSSAPGLSPSAQRPAPVGPDQLAGSRSVQHYKVISYRTLGGTIAAGISITNDGAVSGLSSLSGDGAFHAALWPAGSTAATDLGTLGGVNSAVEWPNHNKFEVVGISQTSMPDPLNEQWSCSAFIPYTG